MATHKRGKTSYNNNIATDIRKLLMQKIGANMSAFLGPIHFWLYNKIQVQNSIVEKIVQLSDEILPELRGELDLKFGKSETRNLEEIIDERNIHGWLQERVVQAEYKLAFSVTSLIKKTPEILKAIDLIFNEIGKEKSDAITTDNANEVYKAISDSLLDGMPCDHANTVIEENDKKVIWKRNGCIHKSYWEEVGGDINIYYALRETFIRGFLSKTTLVFDKVDDTTNIIQRSAEND